jgi:hypothetical protein
VHQFQRALYRAVLAVTAVQRDEGAVVTLERVKRLLGRIKGMGIDALPDCSAARTREPLLRDTSRSADEPPKRTATLPKPLI